MSEQEVQAWILVTGQQNVSGCIHKKSFSFSQVINSVVVALSVVETFFRDMIEKNLFMSTTVVEKTTTCSQCYKAFTGLYLQVCKYRAIFNIICIVKLILLMLDR